MVKDYSKTKIYSIRVGSDVYYGHTIQPLYKRKSQHKEKFNKYPERKLYKAMVDAKMSIDDIELVWVENWPCNSEEEAKARERWWIENRGTLNIQIPNRTSKEYYIDNKNKIIEQVRQRKAEHYEEVLEQKRQHYQKNKERILEQRKQYYQQNKDTIRERDREYKAQYQKDNRDKINSRRRERRAEKKAQANQS